jgi:hypothetical protein
MGGLLAGCVWKDAIGGKPPPTLAQWCSYIVCLTQDPCGRGLAPDGGGSATDKLAVPPPSLCLG